MVIEARNVEFQFIEPADPFAGFRDDIEQFWADCQSRNPSAYSEKILNVFNIDEDAGSIKLQIGFINYYEAFFSRSKGMVKAKPLFSGAYILTADGFCCLAVDKNKDANLIGGLASTDDLENGSYDPELCLIRECKEELGIDIRDARFDHSLKYMRVSRDDEYYFPVGLLYEVKTELTRNELEEIFRSNKHDDELLELKFIRLDGSHRSQVQTRREYIFELLDLITA